MQTFVLSDLSELLFGAKVSHKHQTYPKPPDLSQSVKLIINHGGYKLLPRPRIVFFCPALVQLKNGLPEESECVARVLPECQLAVFGFSRKGQLEFSPHNAILQ